MKTTKRNNNGSDKNHVKRVRRPLRANVNGEAVQKASDQARFQEEAMRAWVENAGVGGVADLYAR